MGEPGVGDDGSDSVMVVSNLYHLHLTLLPYVLTPTAVCCSVTDKKYSAIHVNIFQMTLQFVVLWDDCHSE